MNGGGWIYAAREADAPLVKIGCTTVVSHRLYALERQWHTRLTCVAAVAVGTALFKVERRIHDILRAQRIQGEWFYLHMNQQALEALVTRAQVMVTRRMSIDKLVALAQELGCSTDYLLGLSEEVDSEMRPAAAELVGA